MAMNTMKGTQAFQDTIAQYLMARAENDPLVAVSWQIPPRLWSSAAPISSERLRKADVAVLPTMKSSVGLCTFGMNRNRGKQYSHQLPSGSKPYGRTYREGKGTGTTGRHQQTP